MKKLLSVILLVLILTSVNVISYAEDTKLAEMILAVKEKIEIPAELSEFSSYISESDELVQYNLNWQTPSDYDGKLKMCDVTINSKGDITRYYMNSDYSERPSLAKLSDDEITQIAINWIEKINPGWTSELVVDDIYSEIYSDSSYISFKRYVNGIPFCNNSVTMQINKKNGTVIDYYSNWQYEQNIPSPNNAITLEEAQKKIFEASPLELIYRKYKNTDEAKLVYVPENTSVIIDAYTGKEINPQEFSYEEDAAVNEKAKLENFAVAGRAEIMLTPEELTEVKTMENTLSKEEVLTILNGIENTNFKNMTVNDISYGKYDDKYYVDIGFNKYKSGNIICNFASARLDANTGEIISLYSNITADEKAEKKYKDKSLKIADNFLKKYAPQQRNDIKLVNETEYNIRFDQLVNGYKYDENNISISVCPYTGMITYFRKSWDEKITFEDPSEMITTEKAQQILCQTPGISLEYSQFFDEGDKSAIQLVYRFNSGYKNVRARDGVIVDYSADIPTEEKTVYPTDTAGHYGEQYINTLIKNGVIKSENILFRPEEYITQAEALEMVAALKGYHIPRPLVFDNLFSYMNRNNIIDFEEKNPDIVIDRQTAAKYIVRALGYKEVAEIGGIYKTGFNDEWQISDGFTGYVAIAKGLGIVKGNGNGYFNPVESVKRADFAIMIYNYLSK